jgi:ABC-2 type transport system permease protein
MHKFLATLSKELLLIRRDRAGLLLLFVMPAVLVLVVSLVQNNILETTREGSLRVLLVDEDGGEVGRLIEERLRELGALAIDRQLRGETPTAAAAREAVAGGDYQFGLLIPAGTTEAVRVQARRQAAASLEEKQEPLASAAGAVELPVYFDPIVQGAFRTAVCSSLRLVLLGLETEEKAKVLSELLPQRMNQLVAESFPFGMGPGFDLPELRFEWSREPLLAVREQVSLAGDLPRLPTAVQQNVPAWALFGMFFIVVPLSGTLLRERQEGTLQRLRTIPVSPLLLLAGKVVAYALICLGQFGLMLLIGRYVLPLFGTPALELSGHPEAVLLLALCAALAATGFGILVGTLVGSYEQAAMVGPVAVVVAAALGGIMVPVYVMPKGMQAISAFSPLAWGLSGFLDIFVRDADLAGILPNAFSLLAFFAATLTIAWIVYHRRSRIGG